MAEGDTIRGVRYRGHGGWHEIRALLTVGADGRHSKVRELIGEVSAGNTPPLDVLWFRPDCLTQVSQKQAERRKE